MSSRNFRQDPMWNPDENSGGNMKRFIKQVEQKYNLKFSDYWDFHKWTVENFTEFWAEVWEFSGIIYSKSYDEVVDLKTPIAESPKWFEGARLNFAENLLKFRDNRTAMIAAGEDRDVERMSYKEMYEKTKVYAAALKRIGLQNGDRVACYMSNRIEAVIAMLAVASIGAIWTGALPTLGSSACLNRLKQVNPKFLFTVDQFPYNNEVHDLLKNIKEITHGLPSLEKVIIVPSKSNSKMKNISDIRNSCFLDEFLRMAYETDGTLPDLVFEQVSFSHPAFINYTSGTTGLPKTIVHGAGSLLTTMRDFGLHWDCQRDDVWLSMSAVGWVSWNMISNLLFIGATMLLFEGVPYFVSATYLWDLIDEQKLTRIFITPSVLDEMEDRGFLPTEKHHLTSVKMILSGGSVVKPRNFNFVLKNVKKGTHFGVGCGSTEIMGFCLVTELTLPIYAGEMSSPSLGVGLECLDEEGNHLTGEIGEFAMTTPSPSFPLELWGDVNRKQFKQSYFSKFPGKFTIGDSIIINPITKGVIVCGRSDETLKQRGCRFGSSEIYNVVKLFPEIKDSLCVGQFSKDRDERAVLFIQMREGHCFNEDLVQRLRKRIGQELTVRHVPEVILQTQGIPHNANGKKTEIIVKKIINKMPHNPESVANAECLDFYYDVPELKGF